MDHVMKKRNKVLIGIAVFIVMIIAAVALIFSNIDKNMRALLNEEIAQLDLSDTSDGVYTGEHIVLPIYVKVEVTVKDKKIIAIDLIRHLNGQGSEAETIIDKVIDKQSLNIDTVSGATYSSIVILKAIEDALGK